MKRAFTLVEILIVVLIFAILSGLLFKTYIAITRVAFRLEQEKNVSDSIVTLSRMIQNFADRNTIDYVSKYLHFHLLRIVVRCDLHASIPKIEFSLSEVVPPNDGEWD